MIQAATSTTSNMTVPAAEEPQLLILLYISYITIEFEK